MTKSTLIWVFSLLISFTSLAQDGSDPAAGGRDLKPAPIPGDLLAPFSMTFTIGNNGTVPIDGVTSTTNGVTTVNKMQFTITLRDCRPKPASAAAISTPPFVGFAGVLSDFFDITYNATTNAIEGIQKPNVAIPKQTLRPIVISAEVTSATSTAANSSIGARCDIIPNPSSYIEFLGQRYGQPTDNDVSAIYSQTTQTVMPVSLISFSAQALADRTVQVKWNTSWEQNNKGYTVERSKDLISFEKVGEVNDVAGSSNSINSYQFVDKTPYRGLSYYRLRQSDLDGSTRTYKAEPVEINGRYGVYPNPVVSQHFTLELDEPATAVLNLYNASGTALKVGKGDMTEMSAKITPATKLVTGVYILTVEERGNIRKHRIVVQ